MSQAHTEPKISEDMPSASLSVRSVFDVPEHEKTWMDIALNAPSAWYRHSYNLCAFHRSTAQEKNLIDHSFFILEQDTIVGVAPALFMDNAQGMREISYNGSPTPWPCFLERDHDKHMQYERFAFDHLMKLCRSEKAAYATFGLNAPSLSDENHATSHTALLHEHHFIDSSFASHLVLVDELSPTRIRKSYRKNIRKFSKIYETQTYIGAQVNKEIEQAYFELHVKDAGGQFRPRDSYTKMADLARKKEAAFIIARRKDNQRIVGVLVIAVYKNAAYDSSVSIDPDFHQDYISHLLKLEALHFLFENGISHYELGRINTAPHMAHIPSQKECNISFFKDGFALGQQKKSYAAEKYFTAHALKNKLTSLEKSLTSYFGLDT